LNKYLYNYTSAYSFPEIHERSRKRAEAESSGTESTASNKTPPARKRVGGVFEYKKKRKELSSSDSEAEDKKKKERKRKRKEKRRKAAAAEQDSSSDSSSDSEMPEKKNPSQNRTRGKEKHSPPPPEKEKRTVTSETIDPGPSEPILMCKPKYDKFGIYIGGNGNENGDEEMARHDKNDDDMTWKPLNAVESEPLAHATNEKSR
jgi:hypothetical protein